MVLVWFIAIPIAAGSLAWWLGRYSESGARWVCLGALIVDLALAVHFWWGHYMRFGALQVEGPWLESTDWDWIPQFGIRFTLSVDGISLSLVLLTLLLGIAAVLCSWTDIKQRIGFFHFNVMWILAGILGVFLSMDLFLFYFFWEVMLVPMYFLIGIWGHENRNYAALKFFIFTQGGSLLMLVSILALYFLHHRASGVYTLSYTALLGTPMDPMISMWLMLGFFTAFAVKIPMLPLHTWLPDAHTEAPTAGSVILAGLLLKTGAYGMLRFVVPLFPGAARDFSPVAVALGVAGIIYGAVLAFGQNDLKRLVAYTSVSHLGFVLVGIFAWNEIALQGALMQMICHGVSTGALFILVGALQERTHTRDLRQLGGLWSVVPVMSAVALFFAMASLGLPGLGNFVGEFLVLLGSYRSSPVATAIATAGLVFATAYALAMIQRAFYGPNRENWSFPDLAVHDKASLGLLIVAIIWLGLFPHPVFATLQPALNTVMHYVQRM